MLNKLLTGVAIMLVLMMVLGATVGLVVTEPVSVFGRSAGTMFVIFSSVIALSVAMAMMGYEKPNAFFERVMNASVYRRIQGGLIVGTINLACMGIWLGDIIRHHLQ